ncbi:hypothetical protein D515_02294 [Grimontia indica]|uniref:Uncharacterized protein n=1 Tax=Grimontia indica TaxID=1056512 RepID=R1GRC5_9GAMM|nr:hypothetical protein D515_02294 [Grimontia indica]
MIEMKELECFSRLRLSGFFHFESQIKGNIPKRPEDAGFSEIDWRCDRGVPLQV